MKPVFDRNGRTIAWINNNYIYNLSGNKVLAFNNKNSIFNYGGKHLGRLNNGFFRDKNGNAVAFLQGAKGGPVIPITQIPPIPPIPTIPPIPPIPSIPTIPSIDSYNWSNLTWESFINS